MLNLKVKYQEDFNSNEEKTELVERVEKIFKLPFPDALEVNLSPSSVKKIKYYYSFMLENDISNMEFFIFSKHEKEENSFRPMKNNITFDSIEYIDYGDKFFDTFQTDGLKITLDKFYSKIIFHFLYSNGWTEQSFEFSCSIDKIIN